MTDHDITRTPPALLRRARLLFLVVSVGVPVAITAGAAALIVSWLPGMTGPVVTHWGVNGADGFGPATTYLWLLLVIGLGVPVVSAIATLGAVGAHWGPTARLMGAVAAGMAAFAAALCIGSLAVQRGLSIPDEAPGIGGVLAVAAAALVVVGAACWFLQPRVRAEPGRTLEPRHAVRVAAGERVVWVGTTVMQRGALAIIGVVLVGLIALAVFMVVTGADGAVGVALVTAVVAAALATAAAFRVRVTPEGFAATALSGWPRVRIPVDEITAVRAVDVSPFAEFGGWGWRFSVDGRTGIVTRRGAAIEIARRGRRTFVVTIDGAEQAAALLQEYIDRAGDRRAGRGGSES